MKASILRAPPRSHTLCSDVSGGKCPSASTKCCSCMRESVNSRAEILRS